MDGAIWTYLEQLLPGLFSKAIVAGSLYIAWYFISDSKQKIDSALESFILKADDLKERVHDLDRGLERTADKTDRLSDEIGEHKDALGKASKAIKGDFIELSKTVTEKTLELTSVVQKIEYNFVSTQKSMAQVVTKIEHILSELDKRYDGIRHINEKMGKNETGLATIKKDVDWIKEATKKNASNIEKASLKIALFDDRLKGAE